MNIYLLFIFLIYSFALTISPYRTFLLYVILHPIINQNFAILSQPELPLLSLNMAICFYTFFYYQVFKKKEIRSLKTFPLIIPLYFYLSSIALSTLFSTIPFLQSLVKSLAYINDEWLFILLFWMIIRAKDEFMLILKSYFLIFTIMSFYGILEKTLGYNPIMDFERTWILDPTKITIWFYGIEDRLGMGRIQSLTSHPITYGGLLAIIIVTNFYFLFNHSKLKQNKLIFLSFLILMIINLIFTNSRSPILFLLVGFLGIINLKYQVFSRYLISIIIVISLVLFFFGGYISTYYQNFENLIAINHSNVGGSDLSTRLLQLQLTFELFKQRILFGLGLGSFNPTAAINSELMGGESVWIKYFLERGIFGGLSYIIFIVFMFKKFRIINNPNFNRFSFFMISAFVIFASVTGEMEIRVLFLTVMLIIYQLNIPNDQTYYKKLYNII